MRDPVETVRAMLTALTEEGPSAVLAGYERWMAPDMVWESVLVTGAEGRVFRGPEGLAEYVQDFEDTFTAPALDVHEVVATDPRTVLVLLTLRTQGAGSGVPFELENAYVFSFGDDGLIVAGRSFTSHDEARKAASHA